MPSAWVINSSPVSMSRKRMFPSSGRSRSAAVEDVEDQHLVVAESQMLQPFGNRPCVVEQVAEDDDHPPRMADSAAWCSPGEIGDRPGMVREDCQEDVVKLLRLVPRRDVRDDGIGKQRDPHRVALPQARWASAAASAEAYSNLLRPVLAQSIDPLTSRSRYRFMFVSASYSFT